MISKMKCKVEQQHTATRGTHNMISLLRCRCGPVIGDVAIRCLPVLEAWNTGSTQVVVTQGYEETGELTGGVSIGANGKLTLLVRRQPLPQYETTSYSGLVGLYNSFRMPV